MSELEHEDGGAARWGGSGGAPAVFVSYAHADRRDRDFKSAFITMLAPAVAQGALEVWCDDYIKVGDAWQRNIAEAQARAELGLLLVSPDFLASDFIMGEEIPALLEREVPCAAVLVRPCLWQEVRALADRQWAHDPKRAALELTKIARERLIAETCGTILALLRERAEPKEGSPDQAAPETTLRPPLLPAAELAAEGAPGELDGVPLLPREHVLRPKDMARLKRAILGDEAGAVGVSGAPALGLAGEGGIGKSVLAAALASDPEVRRAFPDGLYWLSVGEQADPAGLQSELARRLGVEEPRPGTIAERAGWLRERLGERRCLVVVDDVWSPATARALAVTGPRGRTLYTTRFPEIVGAIGALLERIDVLDEEAARELLTRVSARPLDDPAATQAILEATGRVALALSLVAATVGRGGRGWGEVAASLRASAETFLDHPYANAFKAMRAALDELSDQQAGVYRALAAFPEDTRIPVRAVERLWAHAAGYSPERTGAELEELRERCLLTLEGGELSFHDLQRAFLLLDVASIGGAHDALLDSYRALLAGGGGWAGLPEREPYIWDHLVYHLDAAGDVAGLGAVARDLGFLTTHAVLGGPYAAERDLAQAARARPDDEAITWLGHLFAQTSHLLSGIESVQEAAAVLRSRFIAAPAGVDLGALEALLPEAYLRPRWGAGEVGGALRRVLEGHAGSVRAVAFSPDGRRLASAGDDDTVRLWDAASGAPGAVLEGHAGEVQAVAFSPDGRRLASAGRDGTVRLWDAASGAPGAVLEGHGDWVWAVAFAPDGRRLASGSEDGTVRLWDAASGAPGAVLEGHAGAVNAVAFAPDGRRLASASWDDTVRLWDAASGAPGAVLEGHAGAVNAVAFAPDGRRLASASWDDTVRLWDAASGAPGAVLEGHAGEVQAVAFSSDGRRLASAGRDGTVRLWDLGRREAVLSLRTEGIGALTLSGAAIALAVGSRVALFELVHS